MKIFTARPKRSPVARSKAPPTYLQCPTCGHVDRESFWSGRHWKCITPTCSVGEADLVPATVEDFRAYMNREDEPQNAQAQ
jgi:hypothetical protein